MASPHIHLAQVGVNTVVTMKQSLIGQMSVKWDPGKYKDEYKSGLLELIEKKVESGGHELEAPKRAAKRPTNVVDLADVLRRSLQATAAKKAKRTAPGRIKPAKKKAA